ncbi:hypothetical protein HPB50_004542 [Hyalomma asiaticum]|uniref:Uncharacterized protein n=1 Tax=Hyalomma asiaticum TaxID=266040 RepID=A0ACB7S0B1_HYAAI|nr:hypothetical protein HPB50_004542 [Hyalomma asiaticum]
MNKSYGAGWQGRVAAMDTLYSIRRRLQSQSSSACLLSGACGRDAGADRGIPHRGSLSGWCKKLGRQTPSLRSLTPSSE